MSFPCKIDTSEPCAQGGAGRHSEDYFAQVRCRQQLVADSSRKMVHVTYQGQRLHLVENYYLVRHRTRYFVVCTEDSNSKLSIHAASSAAAYTANPWLMLG